MKVTLLRHTPFLKKNGTFDMKEALLYQGQIGGICYNEEGLRASFKEDSIRTNNRVKQTTSGEHQSIFEHIQLGLFLEDVPKILNMTLNNEHQYTTSERSLRYTSVDPRISNLTSKEIELYHKWILIFNKKIKDNYPNFKDSVVVKLSQENARYLTSVFIDTQMVHTVPLAQINRIVTYMKGFCSQGHEDLLEKKLVPVYQEFIDELDKLNILDERLQSNRKSRGLSLFGSELDKEKETFSEVYSTKYLGSYASLAQAQRHRTGYYQMERTKKGYFIPPIIQDDAYLVAEWIMDMEQVKENIPQGELVTISEKGTMDSFIMKMKERQCSSSQLEINQQTTNTRDKYYKALLNDNNEYLVNKFSPYMKGQRCCFPDYECSEAARCKHPDDRVKILRKI